MCFTNIFSVIKQQPTTGTNSLSKTTCCSTDVTVSHPVTATTHNSRLTWTSHYEIGARVISVVLPSVMLYTMDASHAATTTAYTYSRVIWKNSHPRPWGIVRYCTNKQTAVYKECQLYCNTHCTQQQPDNMEKQNHHVQTNENCAQNEHYAVYNECQ